MRKIKATHPGKNLGKYLVKAKPKLADKTKIGQTKLKLTNQKNKLGSATVVTSRRKMKRMSTSPTVRY